MQSVVHLTAGVEGLSKRIALGAVALGLSGGVLAGPIEFSPRLPYVGFDMHQRNVKMVEGLGAESFAKRIPQGNLYIGTQFNDYVGLEAGWMFTPTVSREVFIPQNSMFLASLTDPGEWIHAHNKLSMHGAHFDLTGKIPIKGSQFDMIGSMGVTILRIKGTYIPQGDSGTPFYSMNEIETLTRRFSSRRVIPAFSGGVAYKISNMFSLRLLARYELTEKFKNIVGKKLTGEGSGLRMTLKNNVLFGLGLSVQF